MAYSDDLKIIPDILLTGDRSEGLVADRAKSMGFLWHPPGRIEGGLDGVIELRDPQTKGLTSDFVVVQSKGVEEKFKNDDGETFTFNVDARDLAYWLKMSVPVILIVSRVTTGEAYYIAVKEYFADPALRAKRRVTFNKRRDTFGNDPQALLEIARRDANRRSLAASAVLDGPLDTLGLSAELEQAEKAKAQAHEKPTATNWRKGARLWAELAVAIAAKGVPRRLVWPALEECAAALREAGDNADAARARLALARDKIKLDDATAWHHLAGIEWLVDTATLGFEFELASAQTNWFEFGAEALEPLRELRREAKGAADRRESAALLSEVLSIYGVYGEAYAVAGKERRTKVALGPRLSLELDWLDAAGELGRDVELEWKALLDDKDMSRVTEARARILQRRGCYLARRADVDEAEARFREAAALWRGVHGADDQVVEALNSALAAAAMNGRPTKPLPFGAGAAAALARGSAQVPAVRGELLTLRGLNYLLEERYPDALRHLTAALALHHREGNLAAARSTRLFIARALAAAEELAEALGFYIQAGSDKAAAALAQQLTFAEIEPVLRLSGAPRLELAPSFAAAANVKEPLTADEATQIADAVLAAATPPPRIFAPDPHSHARRLLAQIAPLFDDGRARTAVKILRQEVEAGGPLAGTATTGLIRLNEKGVSDSTRFFLERLLAGEDLPVTIAGYLRKASRTTQQRVVHAALDGNQLALIELARADLTSKFPALATAFAQTLEAALAEPEPSEPIEDITHLVGANLRGFGEIARHVTPRLRALFANHLISVVLAAEHDEFEKLAAIDAAREVAPALEVDPAKRLWTLIAPISEGRFPESAPGLITSHPNPKRSRSTFRRELTPERFRAGALLAAELLARRVPDSREELGRATASALASDDRDLLVAALYVAREHALPGVEARLDELRRHPDAAVRDGAAKLAELDG
jgi:hypothetical protein